MLPNGSPLYIFAPSKYLTSRKKYRRSSGSFIIFHLNHFTSTRIFKQPRPEIERTWRVCGLRSSDIDSEARYRFSGDNNSRFVGVCFSMNTNSISIWTSVPGTANTSLTSPSVRLSRNLVFFWFFERILYLSVSFRFTVFFAMFVGKTHQPFGDDVDNRRRLPWSTVIPVRAFPSVKRRTFDRRQTSDRTARSSAARRFH